ncbi:MULTISPECIES: copper-binding protein [Ralstonia]|uniref:Copper-binding protein n=1 Tax=Ralstonia chuxiongensis TaxID=2957504 RepID=A0AA41WYD4_9RALS|nr:MULTISPECIES: copper-binding protein [Ralstonia]MCP1175134.1 copper-binding protein [Ralstonia chuxiongensis]HWV06525.1 copper-binding protein [Ralstonia sp.]
MAATPVFAAEAGSATVTAAAPASEKMSHGEIKKIDTSAGKLTIKHGALENLGMDGMTMVFRVKDPAMLEQVSVGDKIDFVAEQVNGALTVVKMQKSK